MHRRPILAALALTAAAGLLVAGPLSPPAGPVASSYKTLSEVEPRTAINAVNTPGDSTCLYKITQPGSYYLTADVHGVAAKHGIIVAADHVTIDLNGFSVVGVPGSYMGVENVAYFAMSVHNGAVTAWDSYGIYDGGENGRFSDLTCYRNDYQGLYADAGLYAGPGAIVERCVAESNGNSGICISTNSIIRDCVSFDNGGRGIVMGLGANADRCSADYNDWAGFWSTDHATITNCTAYQNQGQGFIVSDFCSVRGCDAERNTQDGILFGPNCLISGNSCRHNTAAGIWGDSTAIRCMVESNDCNGNGTGIKMDGTLNVIRANSCGNNATNFQIVASNRVGTITVMQLQAAINGSSGGNSGTVDPATNFAY